MDFRLSFLQITLFPELFALRRVRDSNPRYDVMRIPHFECGSFDHSDNSPFAFLRKAGAKVLLFSDIRKYFVIFFEKNQFLP